MANSTFALLTAKLLKIISIIKEKVDVNLRAKQMVLPNSGL